MMQRFALGLVSLSPPYLFTFTEQMQFQSIDTSCTRVPCKVSVDEQQSITVASLEFELPRLVHDVAMKLPYLDERRPRDNIRNRYLDHFSKCLTQLRQHFVAQVWHLPACCSVGLLNWCFAGHLSNVLTMDEDYGGEDYDFDDFEEEAESPKHSHKQKRISTPHSSKKSSPVKAAHFSEENDDEEDAENEQDVDGQDLESYLKKFSSDALSNANLEDLACELKPLEGVRPKRDNADEEFLMHKLGYNLSNNSSPVKGRLELSHRHPPVSVLNFVAAFLHIIRHREEYKNIHQQPQPDQTAVLPIR
jgi:hypothetical protein